jgi:hypothetical protein
MKRIYRYVMCLSLIACCLGLAAAAQEESQKRHVGRVQDWTYHHVTMSGGLPAADLERAKTEPRMLFRLVERNRFSASVDNRRFGRGGRDPRRPVPPQSHGLKADWSIPLGSGIVAPNMFPAKYSFDINATASCANDYVVFGLNVAGATPGQANLVGVTNLYSGSTPRLCGAAPTVNWAYNGSTAGGAVLTSPVISLDGKKIAYVESAGAATVFHVLTWKAGQGTAATTAVTPTLNGACNATSSCLKSVTLSLTASDTLSSPWIDYQTDKAFVGTNDGKIYRISCVFNCALNSNPAVDWTYALPVAGTGGAAAQPNGPVYDYPSGRLFVGDQLGELWAINPPGRTGTPAPCTASGASYGITDSVIMDSSGASQRIYAFSGNDGTAGASAVVAQIKMDFTGLVRTHIGLGSVGNTTTNVNIHNGAFDNNYYGAAPSTGELFVCGTGPGDTNPYHYWIGFDAYPVMDSTPTGSIARSPSAAGLACAPFTEIYNPNINLGGGHHDLLISGLMGAGTNGQIITNDISSGSISIGLSNVSYAGGVSGIIVDNVSTSGQASSVYFSTQGVVNVGNCNNARCAVKLTQLDLQ